MTINTDILSIIERSTPLWAAEAEIVRTYWDAPIRTVETDRLWLLRQMYKELWDGFYPSFKWLGENFQGLESSCKSLEMFEEIQVMLEEFAHYRGFATVYAACAAASSSTNSAIPDPQGLKQRGQWAENVELMALRARHLQEHGFLGKRAHRFTEGGYCTLYAEGMKLTARGGVDNLIAQACSQVYEDEFEHMLRGISDIAHEGTRLSGRDWTLLSDLIVEQLVHRLWMRNAQFSFPVDEPRMKALAAGKCEPLEFDFERAFGVSWNTSDG